MKLPLTTFLACIALSAAGCSCGDDDGASPDAGMATADAMQEPDAGGPDADVSPRTVSGTGQQVHVTTTGETQLPIDYSSATVQVLVPDGGGFSVLNGTGGSGVFSVSDVPPGEYYLRVDNSYFVTSASSIDLSRYVAGRSDATTASTSPTTLTFSISAMPTWDADDQLGWYDPNSGAYITGLEWWLSGGPGNGATTLAGSLDYSQPTRAYLVDTASGDLPTISQISWENIDQADIDWVGTTIAHAQPTGLTMINGQASSATGSFTAETLDQQLAVDWALSSFLGAVAASHPGASAEFPFFSIQAQAAGSAHGPFDIGYDVLTAYVADGRTTDISRTFDYGNGTGWDLYAYARVDIAVDHALPGRNPITSRAGYIYSAASVADVASDGLDLVVGPPTALLIGGTDGSTDRDGVGGSPTLSWTAPSAGPASLYRVEIVHLTPQGGSDTGAAVVARLWTEGTSVTVPPGILVNGDYYFARVVAVRSPSLSVAGSPFDYGYPYGEAAAVSGRFSP